MSLYLVRWKFGPNSLLNHSNVATFWYYHFHSTKERAMAQYTSWLLNSTPAMAITVEIFELVQMIPGQEETKEFPMTIDELLETLPENPATVREARNTRIMKLFRDGYSRREIADEMDLTYQTVWATVNRLSKES